MLTFDYPYAMWNIALPANYWNVSLHTYHRYPKSTRLPKPICRDGPSNRVSKYPIPLLVFFASSIVAEITFSFHSTFDYHNTLQSSSVATPCLYLCLSPQWSLLSRKNHENVEDANCCKTNIYDVPSLIE
jgi:hypothetical protein